MTTQSRTRPVQSRAALWLLMAASLAVFLFYRPAQDTGAVAATAAVDPDRPVMVIPSQRTVTKRARWQLLQLADRRTATALGITAERQAKIAKIDTALDKRARNIVTAATDRWERRGGYHACSLPDFNFASSKEGRELQALRARAVEEIERLLTTEERSRWNELCRPKMAALAKPLVVSAIE